MPAKRDVQSGQVFSWTSLLPSLPCAFREILDFSWLEKVKMKGRNEWTKNAHSAWHCGGVTGTPFYICLAGGWSWIHIVRVYQAGPELLSLGGLMWSHLSGQATAFNSLIPKVYHRVLGGRHVISVLGPHPSALFIYAALDLVRAPFTLLFHLQSILASLRLTTLLPLKVIVLVGISKAECVMKRLTLLCYIWDC